MGKKDKIDPAEGAEVAPEYQAGVLAMARARMEASAKWKKECARVQQQIKTMKKQDAEGETVTINLQACPFPLPL